MSSFEKYRVHEVAKDFGLPSKTINEILTKYATTPKNHMQVLSDAELSLIFEYLTQQHQFATVEDMLRVPEQPKKPEAKAEAPKAAEKQQARGSGRSGRRARAERPGPGQEGREAR